MALAANALSTIFMVSMGIIIFIFAPFFAAAFSSTPEVQMLTVGVLRMIAFFQPCSAITQVIESALQGAGDTRYPMFLTLFGIWGIRVCIGYFLGIICGFGQPILLISQCGAFYCFGVLMVANGRWLLYNTDKRIR